MFGPVCPQAGFSSSAEKAPSPDVYSEDCLLLNIWTPVTMPPPGKRWPVVLWLHGGWFAMGDPLQEPGMDATELISTAGLQSIVVGIGYRLNIFGFSAGETLLAANEDREAGAGNFGLWDQRIALEWVHAHIHRFGGDPDNITLGGRSAGAYGVHAQLLYHCQHDANERRLFRRIYMYSNAIPGQPKTLAEAQPQFDEVCRYFKLAPTLSPQEKL
jgi:carboxylesterase type B